MIVSMGENGYNSIREGLPRKAWPFMFNYRVAPVGRPDPRSILKVLELFNEAIAHMGVGQEILRIRGIILEFFAKLMDEGSEVFKLSSILRSPQGIKEA